MDTFDVIVIGAGHAGIEAAWTAARLGSRVGIVTLSMDTVALMPCNPAIGGTAKGHLVREIDALGGLMGRAIDATGIQFKLLNRSRGPAVWSPRAQADKRAYANWMRGRLEAEENITWLVGRAGAILTQGDRVCGIEFEDGATLSCRALVITTGTFLKGLIHIGSEKIPAGRFGEPPAVRLADSIADLGFEMGRLKTGTPPRLDRHSIDFSQFASEPGDRAIVPFSFMTRAVDRPQVPCHIVYTTEALHDLVRNSIAESPLYNGQIEGIGPRYCPSLEDKVMRFPDRERHQIFLEPEGIDVDEIYVNGLSMSLPRDCQAAIVASLPGLERARILRFGYAVEYDFVQPTELNATFESKCVTGLFLAGQINGTSGYEEAAAQGLVAGLNAARSTREQPGVAFRREESYIGILADDLVTRGCLEPYRMFTSRAEYRLVLRIDNADLRLTPIGRELGLVDERRWSTFCERAGRLERNRRALSSCRVSLNGSVVSADRALGRPDVSIADVENGGASIEAVDDVGDLDRATLVAECRYRGYLKKQEADVARARTGSSQPIPGNFVYEGVPGLSREVVDRLTRVRPATLGQAARVPGVTPAAAAIVAARVRAVR